MAPRIGPQYPAKGYHPLSPPAPEEGKRTAGLESFRNPSTGKEQQRILNSRSPRHTPRPGGASAGEALQADAAMQRVLRTPRVFQSNKEHFCNRRQRELRANLLPSILWTPVEGSRPQQEARENATNQADASSASVELTGEYHSKYQEVLKQRERAEEAVRFFLERDQTAHPSEQRRDPQQIVASSCSVLKGLVSDKLAKFRRAQECLVNVDSVSPFLHPEQGTDLEELSGILTLDLERREFPFKESSKRPGFLSLQLTSRVPLIVRDPLASKSQFQVVESERLHNNDLHLVRVDLQPGEVRQVSYGLDNADFKATDLAGRMSAVIDPERGVLARLVRELRAKEGEARALNGVLSDILRDLPVELPSTPAPELETARSEEARAARLNTLVGEPQQTLARLLECIEVLAALAAPLVPSLAHALDRVALICVREVDRLAARCHEDYESLLQLWTRTEEERRELVSVIDRMGGKVDGSGGVELRNRVAKLNYDLQQQEQLYADLLKEKSQQQNIAEEAQRSVGALRSRVQEMQTEITELQREKRRIMDESKEMIKKQATERELREQAFTKDDLQSTTDSVPTTVGRVIAHQLLGDLEKRTGSSWAPSSANTQADADRVSHSAHSKAEAIFFAAERGGHSGPSEAVGSHAESKDSPSQASRGESPDKSPLSRSPTTTKAPSPSTASPKVGRDSTKKLSTRMSNPGFFNFALTKGTQTETEHIFSDSAPQAEELSYTEFEETMRISKRLYRMLGKYEWNEVSHKYFLTAENPDEESDEDPVLIKKQDSPSPVLKGATARVLALRGLKQKVERAHTKAHIVQLEEEIHRLEACAKESFEPWIARVLKDLQSPRKGVTEVPINPDELWGAVTELVHTESMRQRIRELEDHLASLLPLAERARGSEQGGEQGTDSVFWKRVMRMVRQKTMTRKGSAVATAAQPGQRRSSLLGSYFGISMDLGRLLAELASIWVTVVNTNTGVTKVVGGRLPAQQVLQGCIKTFYLRKSGRSKHVEAAVVALCRAVLDFSAKSPKVALFAVMVDIQPATAMTGRLPVLRREIGMQLDPQVLQDLPLDAAHAMAAFMRELKSLQRSKKFHFSANQTGLRFQGDEGESADTVLPLQLVLAASFSALTSVRSSCFAGFFQRVLFGFVDMPPLDFKVLMSLEESPRSRQISPLVEMEAKTPADSPPPGTRSLSPAPGSSRPSQAKGVGSPLDFAPTSTYNEGFDVEFYTADQSALAELMYVSNLVAAHVWQGVQSKATGDAQEDLKLRAEGVDKLWSRILEVGGTSSNLRRSLGLAAATSASAQKVAQLLVKINVVSLPWQMVARTLQLASGQAELNPNEAQIQKVTFSRFCNVWQNTTDDGGARCRESMALWAGLWSMAFERQHEVELMGTMFQLYDTSGDGWLQFEEFCDFIQAIAPNVTRSDAEDLFLCGAEEVSGDMTKQVFLQLILRLGITLDIHHLETLVESKKANMYGSEAPEGL